MAEHGTEAGLVSKEGSLRSDLEYVEYLLYRTMEARLTLLQSGVKEEEEEYLNSASGLGGVLVATEEIRERAGIKSGQILENLRVGRFYMPDHIERKSPYSLCGDFEVIEDLKLAYEPRGKAELTAAVALIPFGPKQQVDSRFLVPYRELIESGHIRL